MLLSGLLLHAICDLVNEKNIRSVLVMLIKLAEKYVASTENDLDDRIVENLKNALNMKDGE